MINPMQRRSGAVWLVLLIVAVLSTIMVPAIAQETSPQNNPQANPGGPFTGAFTPVSVVANPPIVSAPAPVPPLVGTVPTTKAIDTLLTIDIKKEGTPAGKQSLFVRVYQVIAKGGRPDHKVEADRNAFKNWQYIDPNGDVKDWPPQGVEIKVAAATKRSVTAVAKPSVKSGELYLFVVKNDEQDKATNTNVRIE